MKIICIALILSLFTIPFLSVVAFAQAPGLPCRFHGSAQLDGYCVADGTIITATIAGDIYTTTTPSVYGASTYLLNLSPASGVYYSPGTEIILTIDGYPVEQIGTWETGGNIVLDISASSILIPTPTPSPSPTTTPTPTPIPTPEPTINPTPTPSPTITIPGNNDNITATTKKLGTVIYTVLKILVSLSN